MEAAVRGVGLLPAFQPIVTLKDHSVIGFEALARWPSLGAVAPQDVFAHARANGDAERLDQLCIDAAIERALSTPLPSDAVLSLNCEPATVHRAGVTPGALSRAKERFQVMFEITERSLLARPRLLLQQVAALRADGFLIALDDVGAHPESSALLDVISPDVIKLDLALVQSQPDYSQAQTLSAVLAHHERTGAAILAEGIENEAHLEQALALGAELGQGFWFGAPGDADAAATGGHWSPQQPAQPRSLSPSASPFGLIAGHHRLRTARKATVVAFSKHIEAQAHHAADPPMVLAALQRAEHLTARTLGRYRDLAVRSPLVAVFAQQMPAEVGGNIRGVALQSTDPLCTEWTVVTLGPHTAAALIAREHPDTPPDTADVGRRFEFVITYDRGLVTAAAHSLLNRMV
ncbi:sensor domain-containing phosphodiesterase [Mycolicibacterium mengxianglii]|uniref:sensor domain-containing phosphodiesterase n=1 Tax=Mycolicibacterium mengxianglii TaxID=2736649 RepID=UPI0018D041A2|nr:EAL domain-containing protein [Mycolicibacterium mengxianglii]